MSKNTRLILATDSDGVLFNFLKSACKVLNVEYPRNYIFESDTWLYEKCGLTKKQFWSKIHGHDFWVNLEPFPWAQELIDVIDNNVENWIVLSKPSLDSGAYSGKFEAFQKHFGIGNRLWLSARNKEYFAGEGKILIDDKKETCEKWAKAGGWAWHWPEMTEDIDRKEIDDRLEKLDKFLKSFN